MSYLSSSEVENIPLPAPNQVDYGNLYNTFFPVLKIAHRKFLQSPDNLEKEYGKYKESRKKLLESSVVTDKKTKKSKK